MDNSDEFLELKQKSREAYLEGKKAVDASSTELMRSRHHLDQAEASLADAERLNQDSGEIEKARQAVAFAREKYEEARSGFEKADSFSKQIHQEFVEAFGEEP